MWIDRDIRQLHRVATGVPAGSAAAAPRRRYGIYTLSAGIRTILSHVHACKRGSMPGAVKFDAAKVTAASARATRA